MGAASPQVHRSVYSYLPTADAAVVGALDDAALATAAVAASAYSNGAQ